MRSPATRTMSLPKRRIKRGTIPSALCLEIVRFCPPVRPLRVLDIGCGEGKDAVFLARLGYRVSAFDLALSGVEKTKRLAEQAGVSVDVFRADVNDYRPTGTFDILYSSGALHYLRPELRGEDLAYRRYAAIDRYKELYALLYELIDRHDIYAVALILTVRYIVFGICSV